jgi:multicomponent Na+:H+ antiporter subunit D
MAGAAGLLGVGCVAFGIFPYTVLHRIVEPAAGGLLASSSYANGLLTSGSTSLPVPAVNFDYFSPSGWATALGTVAAGLLLAAWYVRRASEPKPVTWLRALHTGSVNDYTAYLAVGGIITVSALLHG